MTTTTDERTGTPQHPGAEAPPDLEEPDPSGPFATGAAPIAGDLAQRAGGEHDPAVDTLPRHDNGSGQPGTGAQLDAPEPRPASGRVAEPAVAVVRVVETGSFANARCTCGWVGPARRARKRARQDAAEHLAAGWHLLGTPREPST